MKIYSTLTKVQKISKHAVLPTRATEGSAGFDLYSCLERPISINPNERLLVSTGIAMELPSNHCGMVCSRSGLAAKQGIFVLNAPGIIDSDYRGEIKVILYNLGNETATIKHAQRIAQLVIVPITTPELNLIDEISDTTRGTSGFGSSGL